MTTKTFSNHKSITHNLFSYSIDIITEKLFPGKKKTKTSRVLNFYIIC
jgi:hypothetical protein